MTAIAFPASLPGPSIAVTTPAERRLLSDLTAGPQQFRGKQRDYLATQQCEWSLLSAADSATFDAWWDATLSKGSSWFASAWPAPPGWSSAVRRFFKAPQWTALPGGFWKVTATFEVRGRGLAPLDPYVECELLLHFDQSTPAGWIDYSRRRRAIAQVPSAGTISASAAGNFAGAMRLAQSNPGSSTTPNNAAYLTAAGNINLSASEFFVSAWVKLDSVLPDDTGPGRVSYTIIDCMQGNGVSYSPWFFALTCQVGTANAFPQFAIYGVVPTNQSVSGGLTSIPANTWTHVAASRKNGAGFDFLTTFVNGVVNAQTSFATGYVVNDAALGYTRVGAADRSTSPGSQSVIYGFQGLMDEVYVIKGPGTGVSSSFTPPVLPFGS